MLQNIKVDIIYHKSPTDFEMEFNLCGCCRMRLLTDKSPDTKTLVHNLARAVSRSRIIIITGNLFGDDSIISTVSTAIGNKLTAIENSEYGINSSEKIMIINGSTPLITSEGYFGGCIIESGPQTIILLSENKNIRKNIMQTLIHSYIKELASSEPNPENNKITAKVSEKQVQSEEEIGSEEISNNAEDVIDEELDEVLHTDDEEIAKTSATDEMSDNQQIIIDDAEDQNTSAEDNFELNIETSYEDDKDVDNNEYIPVGVPLDTNPIYKDMFLGDPENEDDQQKKYYRYSAEDFAAYEKGDLSSELLCDEDEYEDESAVPNKLALPILITSIIVLILLALIIYFGIYLPLKSNNSSAETIKTIFETLFPRT